MKFIIFILVIVLCTTEIFGHWEYRKNEIDKAAVKVYEILNVQQDTVDESDNKKDDMDKYVNEMLYGQQKQSDAQSIAQSMRGVWRNEFGSIMFINRLDNDGYFTGSYVNAAGNFTSPCKMVGTLDHDGSSIGWTVLFNSSTSNTHTVTSWVGNYDSENIRVNWLMKSSAKSDEWKTLNFGYNHFMRSD